MNRKSLAFHPERHIPACHPERQRRILKSFFGAQRLRMTAVFLAVLLFVGPLLPQSARAEEFFPEGEILEGEIPEDEIPEDEIPEDAAPVPALDLNGLGCVFLGDVLPLVYPELSVWDVAELTELVPYDDSPASVSVVFENDDYVIAALRDFVGDDAVTLRLCTWDDREYLFCLYNGLVSEPEPEPEPEPKLSFLFHSPEDTPITFGVETQSVGFASVSDVSDMPEGARIMLYIDSPSFVNVDDPAEIIPLSITDAEGNDVICLWDEFTGERTVELFIHVSADDWARAALGGYAATINYRAAVE